MSRSSERRGVRIGFGLLAVLAIALLVRLGQLQLVADRQAALGSIERQGRRAIRTPAPRGSILDRHGECLAYDRPVFEVRAEARFRTESREGGPSADYVQTLGAELAWALSADAAPGEGASIRNRWRATLRGRIRSAVPRRRLDRRLPRKRGQTKSLWQRSIDFLVASSVDSALVVARLRELARKHWYLTLHFRGDYERVYPAREATFGIVGHVGEIELPNGTHRVVHTGIEQLRVLAPGRSGERPLRVDARARRFHAGLPTPPDAPVVVQTTLDLGLQQDAVRHLGRAVGVVEKRYQSPPTWGALLLVEIASGDLLAAASYRRGTHPAAGAFAPTQSLCAPGSVVKPLVFALALEAGALDWELDRIDCRPNRPRNGWRVPGARRTITDEHRCEVISAHDILVQSSNIGAVQVGLRLGREHFAQFLDLYQFGRPSGCGLPGERAGTVQPPDRDLGRLSERMFSGYTAPSFSIGYDYNVSPIQVTRAYLTLLSGAKRDLRVFRRYRIGTRTIDVPRPPTGPRVLSDATLARLRAAMVDVVGDHENATGKPILARLRELGYDHGTIAGKTGTSEETRTVDGRRVMVRTALFAGFLPVDAPRYLAVCVLQKERASSFWGGRYAGPAAAELLLDAATRATHPRRPGPDPRRAHDSVRSRGPRGHPCKPGAGGLRDLRGGHDGHFLSVGVGVARRLRRLASPARRAAAPAVLRLSRAVDQRLVVPQHRGRARARVLRDPRHSGRRRALRSRSGGQGRGHGHRVESDRRAVPGAGGRGRAPCARRRRLLFLRAPVAVAQDRRHHGHQREDHRRLPGSPLPRGRPALGRSASARSATSSAAGGCRRRRRHRIRCGCTATCGRWWTRAPTRR